MNSKDFLKEGFIEDASDVHMDHEVQMAREECYHAAEHALAIHKLLRNISEQQGLEGWVSSKITLANDYLNTVREHLEYELLQPQADELTLGMPIAENEQQGVTEAPVQWHNTETGVRDAAQTDHTMDEALSYLKTNYPAVKMYNVRRAEMGSRAVDHPKYFDTGDESAINQNIIRKSAAHMSGVDSAVDYLQLKKNTMMSGSKQISATIGYSWSVYENPASGIAILYYQDRGMAWDEIYLAGKTPKIQAQARQVFRDAGVLPTPIKKSKQQGMAEGLDIDFNKNFAYQRDIAKKSPAYVTGFKDGYHNKPKNDMKFPSGDERKNYKLGYRDGQSGHTKRVDVMGKKGVAEGSYYPGEHGPEGVAIPDKIRQRGKPGGTYWAGSEEPDGVALDDPNDVMPDKKPMVKKLGPKARAKTQMVKMYGDGDITFRKTSNGGYFIQHEDDFGDTHSHQFDPKTGKVDFSGVTRSTYYGEGVAEGKKSDRYHIVDKDGKPANLASYADKASAIKDRDEKYPGAVVQQVGPRGKVKGVAEGFPHDVDHMPGPRIKNPQTGCERCHGKGYVYKTADGKVLPSNEQGAKRYKCGACGGIGFVKKGVAESTTSKKAKDFISGSGSYGANYDTVNDYDVRGVRSLSTVLSGKVDPRWMMYAKEGLWTIEHDSDYPRGEWYTVTVTDPKHLRDFLWLANETNPNQVVIINSVKGVAEGSKRPSFGAGIGDIHVVYMDGKPKRKFKREDDAIDYADDLYDRTGNETIEVQNSEGGVVYSFLDEQQGVAEGTKTLAEIDIDTLNQLASHAVNTLGQGGANFAAGATGGLVGGAIAGGTKKAVDWYYKKKQKKAEAERKKSQQKGVAEGAKCNQTMEGKSCPVHGLQECPGMKARALAEWKKIQRTKKLKEQGITDQEIRQRIQPTFQATDAQINDPEWMRSRGLIPMQDIERDYKDTLEKENYTDAVAKAASQGLPVFQHKGQTYATKNPDYNKYYTDKDPGHSKGGEPMALNKQQTHQLAGTNIVSGSGAPVIAGSKMLKPNPNTSGVNETTAGSVAGVVNPKSDKPKSKIGSLFGGTYKQPKKRKQ